jgi:hypothetical protein
MINAAAANTLVNEHSIPGNLIENIVAGGDIWPDDECTIRNWLMAHPDCAVSEWDDGDSHDRSIIRCYEMATPQGEIVVWSYNNNAWGFADAYAPEDAPPKTVEEFCREYADNAGHDEVEQWILDMAGIDEEETE